MHIIWYMLIGCCTFLYLNLLFSGDPFRNKFEETVMLVVEKIAAAFTVVMVILVAIVLVALFAPYRIPVALWRVAKNWIERKKSHQE